MPLSWALGIGEMVSCSVCVFCDKTVIFYKDTQVTSWGSGRPALRVLSSP